MTITVYSEITYPTYVRRRYEVTLTDNIGGVHVDVLGMYNHQPDNDGLEVEAECLANKKADEIQTWIADMEQGLDPAFVDAGGYFVHSVPLWNTWEDVVSGAITPSLQSDYMQDILNCDLTCSRMTKAELEVVAGKNNEVRADQAIATNTQVELDAYVPLIDENGDPR